MRTWGHAVLLFFTLVFYNDVVAACRGEACVSVGSNLASVDSRRSALLGGVFSNLLGSDVSINTSELNALAQGEIELAGLLQGLQGFVGVADSEQALNTPITLSQFYEAAAGAANTAESAAALQSLSQQASGVTDTFVLSDLLELQGDGVNYNGLTLNALELATGGVQAFNGSNVLVTNEPVQITGAELGLGDLIQSLALRAQVVEPAKIVCGPEGSTFHGAAVRLQLDLDLVDIALDASVLSVLPGVDGVEAALGQLQLYVDVSRASGVIQSIDALAQAVTVQATPGVADLYLGSFPEDVFSNTSGPMDPSQLDFTNIGTLSIATLLGESSTVSIQAKAAAEGSAPFTDLLNFFGPFPETQRSSTSADVLSVLLNSLLENLTINVSPEPLGLPVDVLLPVLQGTSANTLSPILSSVLTDVADPLLESLGVGIGEADVTVHGIKESCQFAGQVYHDVNHDHTQNAGDSLCPETLYIKRLLSDKPNESALEAVSVDSATGRYTFTGVDPGQYLLVLDTNDDLIDISATAPQGWLHTESGDGVQAVSVNTSTSQGKNFGLFHGSHLSGLVFEDNGSGDATPHNGQPEATEQGLDGIEMVFLFDGSERPFETTRTQAGGVFEFWVPASAGAGAVTMTQRNGLGYLSVSGNPGNTGGVYSLADDSIRFDFASGQRYQAVYFGDARSSSLQSDQQKSAVAGSPVFYSHVFNPGSEGQLLFAWSSPNAPDDPWQSVLYKDNDCDGQVDESDLLLDGEQAVTANQSFCVILKTFVPVQANVDANHLTTLSATFTYANTEITTQHQVNDITNVLAAHAPVINLQKIVAQASASPGDTLVYTIRFENIGSELVSELKIHDNTPAYTVFAGARCVDQQLELACEVLQQPQVGNSGSISWVIANGVPPGVAGTVEFSVLVQ